MSGRGPARGWVASRADLDAPDGEAGEFVADTSDGAVRRARREAELQPLRSVRWAALRVPRSPPASRVGGFLCGWSRCPRGLALRDADLLRPLHLDDDAVLHHGRHGA